MTNRGPGLVGGEGEGDGHRNLTVLLQDVFTGQGSTPD